MTKPYLPSGSAQRAVDVWVVFSGRADMKWLKILKPGFRHCFVLIHDGYTWLAIDPMSHYTDVSVLPIDPEYNLPGWMAGEGLSVVKAIPDRTIQKPAPTGVYTCVEVIKRYLGIHRRFIFTPWQLYRYLQRHHITRNST